MGVLSSLLKKNFLLIKGNSNSTLIAPPSLHAFPISISAVSCFDLVIEKGII